MKWKKLISFWEFLIFILFCSLSLFFLLFYLNWMGSSLIHKGIKSLHKKNYIQAQKYFNQALAKKPFDPWIYLNLALNHDLLNVPDKAIQTYDIISSSLSKQSNLAIFFSYFNKGELNGRLNQLEKALENYQKALEFNYKEKEIKKNIELLFQNQKKDQKGNEEEKQDKDQSKEQQEKDNKDQQDDNSNNKDNSSNTADNQSSQEEDKQSEVHGQMDKESKGLSDKEQKAILEEIEKQENKVRAKFYKGKKIFGDKQQKDW